MSDEKKNFPNLPPGFSEDDFIPINIKSVKENEQGFEIEIKPNREKEEGAKYHFELRNGVYHILRNNKAIYTPGRKVVMVTNESLAQRTADHLNIYGEEYESPYSIVCFVYSYLDFFEIETIENLKIPILNDYDRDWILKKSAKWVPKGDSYKSNFQAWLKTLTKFQIGTVIIFGASLSSVNTAYLLSNVWEKGDFNSLAQDYFDLRMKRRTRIVFWQPNDLEKIFENYLFCQGLGI